MCNGFHSFKGSATDDQVTQASLTYPSNTVHPTQEMK